MKNDVVEAAIFTVGAESFAMRRNAIVRAMPEWRDANARLREADIQAAAQILATLERREPTRAALLRLTDQSANIDRLYGPAHASDRAAILSVLCGCTVPKSRAGWHLFRSVMFAAFGLSDIGGCLWERQDALRAAVLGNARPLPLKLKLIVAGERVIVSESELSEWIDAGFDEMDSVRSCWNRQRCGIHDALVAWIPDSAAPPDLETLADMTAVGSA